MSISRFHRTKVIGIKTVIPQRFIDIDDELEYFENNPKKLQRAKKMIGYGRRYLADPGTTVTDLAVDAAEKLLAETQVDRSSIDLLIFANQKPDYREPNDACLAHGRLKLGTHCAAIHLLAGCSGYVYALWTASNILESGGAKKCLLLAGDIASYGISAQNRKLAPLFGDAASATLLERTDNSLTFYAMGTAGEYWDKIITPFGGIRLAPTAEELSLQAVDAAGNTWTCRQPMMEGESVFQLMRHYIPENIKLLMSSAGFTVNDIDFFAFHQANRQIVDGIADLIGIPSEKYSSETFSSYANNSTTSVATVLCDQLSTRKVANVVLCSFGIGFSWGSAVLDLSHVYNGGISCYDDTRKHLSRSEEIQHWIQMFKER